MFVLKSISAELFSSAIEEHELCSYARAARSFDMCARLNPSGPVSLNAYFNLSSIMQMAGYPDLAVQYLEPVLSNPHMNDEENDMVLTAHQFLWALAQDEISRDNAIKLYRKLSLLGDLRADHKLATLVNEGKSALHGNPEYARKVFDQLASIFEERLTGQLGYDVPRMLEQDISKHLDSKYDPDMGKWRILDIGCGSGLCGKFFSSYCSFDHLSAPNLSSAASTSTTITSFGEIHGGEVMFEKDLRFLMTSSDSLLLGVDVSGKMIDICRSSGSYSHAIRCSLQDALLVLSECAASCHGVESRFHLVLAADTFIYVGALSSTFKYVHDILTPHGIFAFSIEEKSEEFIMPSDKDEAFLQLLDQRGSKLLRTSRYGHNVEYIHELCRVFCFNIESELRINLRSEFDVSVMGYNFLLRKM